MATNVVKLGPGYYPNPEVGRALANADIYIGEPDKEPQDFPKTVSVQQEDGDIVAITQPIQTGSGGVPLYNGSSVILLVDGEYSMQVLDSTGSQVYYTPKSLDNNPVTFSDADFEVFNDADNTKVLDFDLSNIPTGTKNTVTLPSEDVDFTNQKLFSPLDADGNQVQWSQGSNVTAASELVLGTDGNTFFIFGSTTIDTISGPDIKDGTIVCLVFANVPLIVDTPGVLILPAAGGNIQAAQEDVGFFQKQETGVWRCLSFQPKNGGAIVDDSYLVALGAPVASTSGVSIDFTGIPSGVKRVTINFVGVSTTGTSPPLIQIGDAGGIESTGYLGSSTFTSSTSNVILSTTGFVINLILAADVKHGSITISLEDDLIWACSGVMGVSSASGGTSHTAGSKTLSAELDRVRITTAGGSDTFDAGQINISYER